MTQKSLSEKLDDLLNTAVEEGRTNWDPYYGYGNEYHMATIKELPLYKELLSVLTS